MKFTWLNTEGASNVRVTLSLYGLMHLLEVMAGTMAAEENEL